MFERGFSATDDTDGIRGVKTGLMPERDQEQIHSSLELLLSAQAGDSEAAELLCRRYLPPLRRWAHGRLPRWARDLVNTDDLIQETLVRAIKRVEDFEYQRSGAFHAYLRQGIRNGIKDQIRRVARQPLKESVGSGRPAGEQSPLEQAIGREVLARYEQALASLRPVEQEAVIARIELGLSYAELADILGKPSQDAARMTVNRALVRLAERMAELSQG